MEATAPTDKPQKRVRFRVASGSSGRVLKEMFKDEGPSDSVDSDCTSSSDAERASTPSTSGDLLGHGLCALGSELDDSEGEPDDLLLYAGATKDWTFTTKRVNILSKNGTIRGVRHKVSAGQTLFESLPGWKSVSTPDRLFILYSQPLRLLFALKRKSAAVLSIRKLALCAIPRHIKTSAGFMSQARFHLQRLVFVPGPNLCQKLVD